MAVDGLGLGVPVRLVLPFPIDPPSAKETKEFNVEKGWKSRCGREIAARMTCLREEKKRECAVKRRIAAEELPARWLRGTMTSDAS